MTPSASMPFGTETPRWGDCGLFSALSEALGHSTHTGLHVPGCILGPDSDYSADPYTPSPRGAATPKQAFPYSVSLQLKK